jgi:hypothetical protein
MPAGSTYTPIQTTTLGSAQATVTLSSISGIYTDLVLVISTRFTGGGGASAIQAQFNSDSGSNYSQTVLNGNGSTASSFRSSNVTSAAFGLATDTANEFATSIIQLQNYSNTTTYKTSLARTNIASDRVRAIVNLWRSTSAINSIYLQNNGATTFVAGSTFTLYGILSA